ncbi:hypothetical protein EJ06DRAFT_546845 [Trichodelitschia bisporula]|uniref:Uncharacterized protein n=1 Tax=Trichodelitschia bisporula TaxID=703511 RepID=A0A6G1I679_9PEZI|nr:hypothetical protein EJ06DRAFT_546845 [Trichodelitschia bisporula]
MARDGKRPAWDVKRANRLMRPMTVKIEALRRLKAPSKPAAKAANPQSVKAPEAKPPAHFQGSAGSPDWVKPARKVRLYSAAAPPNPVGAAASTQPAAETDAGQLSIPSPYINRTSAAPDPSDVMKPPPPIRISRRPSNLDTNDLQGGLIAAFVEVLWATASDSTLAPSTAPDSNELKPAGVSMVSSLKVMCARAIPAAISWELDQCSDLPTDERDDVITRVYEEFQFPDTKDVLPQTVRAHAIHLIKRAMSEGLIRPSVIFPLLNLKCVPLDSNEAEELLYVDVHQHVIARLEAESGCCQKLECFATSVFAAVTPETSLIAKRRLQFKLTKNLLEMGFPVEWTTLTGMLPVWQALFCVFVECWAAADVAADFLSVAMELATGVRQASKDALKTWEAEWVGKGPNASKEILEDRLTTTIYSLTTILAAFGIAPMVCVQYRSKTDGIVRILNNLAVEMVAGYGKGAGGRTGHKARRASYVVAATILTQITGHFIAEGPACVSLNDLVGFLQDNFDDGILDMLPDFVISVAGAVYRLTSAFQPRAIGEMTFPLILRFHIITKLMKPSVPGLALLPSTKFFLRRVGMATALMYPGPGSLEWSDWVTTIGESLSREERKYFATHPLRIPVRPKKNPQRVQGFRWDEGICEWVSSTPMAGHHILKSLFTCQADKPLIWTGFARKIRWAPQQFMDFVDQDDGERDPLEPTPVVRGSKKGIFFGGPAPEPWQDKYYKSNAKAVEDEEEEEEANEDEKLDEDSEMTSEGWETGDDLESAAKTDEHSGTDDEPTSTDDDVEADENISQGKVPQVKAPKVSKVARGKQPLRTLSPATDDSDSDELAPKPRKKPLKEISIPNTNKRPAVEDSDDELSLGLPRPEKRRTLSWFVSQGNETDEEDELA